MEGGRTRSRTSTTYAHSLPSPPHRLVPPVIATDSRSHTQLLGFTLPPRAPQPTLTHLPRRSNNRSSGRSGAGGAGYGGAFDRSRFVHTFRFIVKPDKGAHRVYYSLSRLG